MGSLNLQSLCCTSYAIHHLLTHLPPFVCRAIFIQFTRVNEREITLFYQKGPKIMLMIIEKGLITKYFIRIALNQEGFYEHLQTSLCQRRFRGLIIPGGQAGEALQSTWIFLPNQLCTLMLAFHIPIFYPPAMLFGW